MHVSGCSRQQSTRLVAVQTPGALIQHHRDSRSSFQGAYTEADVRPPAQLEVIRYNSNLPQLNRRRAWLINLHNFTDGSDGLAGGRALIGFGAHGFGAWLGGDTLRAASSWTIPGAVGRRSLECPAI